MTNSCFQWNILFYQFQNSIVATVGYDTVKQIRFNLFFFLTQGRLPLLPFWHWVILVQTPTVYIFLFSVLINIAEPIPPIFTLVLALSQNPITVISSFLTHRELSFQKREPDLRSYHSTNPALRIVISCEIGKSVSSVYTAVAWSRYRSNFSRLMRARLPFIT